MGMLGRGSLRKRGTGMSFSHIYDDDDTGTTAYEPQHSQWYSGNDECLISQSREQSQSKREHPGSSGTI